MKILHLISSGGMYGAEAVILNLSQALIAAGDASEIALFENLPAPNHDLERAAAQQSLTTHRIPCSGQIDLSVGRRLRELVHATQADIIHAHGYKADIYAWSARRSSSPPLLSTCHTWYDNTRLLRAYGIADRYILRSFAAVVAVSKEVHDRLLHAGVPPGRVSMIANGIDPKPFQQDRPAEPDPTRPLTVGLVGRLSHEKGIDLFLQAAASVLKQLPQTRFIVFGEGPDRPALEHLLHSLKLTDQVSLPGRRDDMPAVYASLDVLVSSSRQEGLPVSLLEAMASGLPILATAVGEVPSLIRHQQTGLLVAPNDVPSLSQAITTLLTDPALRHRLGARAAQLVATEFSANTMTGHYRHLYRSLLTEPSPAPGLHP